VSYPKDFEMDRAQERFWSSARPVIVCLCGSTRFWRTFQDASLRETMKGRIVLSIGAARGADDDDPTFGGFVPAADYDATKEQLDALHFRKIELADEVIILNCDGDYVGESTGRELAHARQLGKVVRWFEPTRRALAGELVG
jgi:hypothetical protein